MTGAIILAGGNNSRMKTDKALLKIGDTTIIERLIESLQPCFDSILISTQDKHQYGFLGLPVIRDEQPENGPLMGIYSSLKSSQHDVNFIIACDIPELDTAFIRTLLCHIHGYDAVIPLKNNRYEPLLGVYRKSIIPVIKQMLENGERKVSLLLDRIRVKTVPMDSETWYININTPEAYEKYIHSMEAENDPC